MRPHRSEPSAPRRVWVVAAVLATALSVPTLAVALPLHPSGGAALVGAASKDTALGLKRAARRVADNATAVQKRLVAIRYLPAAAVTGRWDYRTSQAVMAFQAWQGLQRDGTVGPKTLAALAIATAPLPRTHVRGRMIEIYRALGVTLLVDNGRVVRALHSSGGKPGYATPAGTYAVFRKESSSWSYPYRTWLPYASYFNGGIALHAYADVPAYPASHGCVRIPTSEAAFVYQFAAYNTPVTVY